MESPARSTYLTSLKYTYTVFTNKIINSFLAKNQSLCASAIRSQNPNDSLHILTNSEYPSLKVSRWNKNGHFLPQISQKILLMFYFFPYSFNLYIPSFDIHPQPIENQNILLHFDLSLLSSKHFSIPNFLYVFSTACESK